MSKKTVAAKKATSKRAAPKKGKLQKPDTKWLPDLVKRKRDELSESQLESIQELFKLLGIKMPK